MTEGDQSPQDAGRAGTASEVDGASGSDPQSASDVTTKAGDVSVFGRAIASTTGRTILAAVGCALVIAMVFVVRGCGGDGEPSSDALLLVREGSGDLYVGSAHVEVDRSDRVVRDFNSLARAVETRDGVWWSVGLVEAGSRRVLVADALDGAGAWVIEESEAEEIVSESGAVEVVVAGDALYLREAREGTQRCYRASLHALDDRERVFRGDACAIAYSGHILGATSSGDSYRVTVWSPLGDETAISRANFQGTLSMSDNGRFVVSGDDEGVTVTSVDTGDRIWELDGGVDFDLASHPGGHIALAATADSGEAYLVAVDGAGDADELLEVRDGQIVAEFAVSGDLFWIESGEDDRGVLSVWDVSQKEVIELAEEEGLRLIGVHEGAALTVIEDDLGALFQRFLPTDRGTELHEFDDEVQRSFIHGGFLYLAGSEIASVVPLDGGEAVDSLVWDEIEILDFNGGLLLAVGTDGTSEVLFSMRSGSESDVEYGDFDEVVSGQIYGSSIYATVRDGLGLETLVFDVSSGDLRDDAPDYGGYRLVNSRAQPIRSTLVAVGQVPESFDLPAEEESLRPAEPEPSLEAEPEPAVAAEPEPSLEMFLLVGTESGNYRGELVYSGDTNRYRFRIPEGGRWLAAETNGNLDLVANLFRSGSDTSIASNDDGGAGYNARLDLFLDPGLYVIEVRGYDDEVVGAYGIDVWFY